MRTEIYSLRIRGALDQEKCTQENAAAFGCDVYEGFQRKEQTLAVTIDPGHSYKRVQFKLLMDLLLEHGVSLTITQWITATLLQLGNWALLFISSQWAHRKAHRSCQHSTMYTLKALHT